MGTSDQDDPFDPLRERVRNAPRPVQYDVAAGLERHRRLLAAGAPLPAWETEIPQSVLASRPGLWRPWFAGALFGLGLAAVVGWLSWPAPEAEVRAPRLERASAPSGIGIPVVTELRHDSVAPSAASRTMPGVADGAAAAAAGAGSALSVDHSAPENEAVQAAREAAPEIAPGAASMRPGTAAIRSVASQPAAANRQRAKAPAAEARAPAREQKPDSAGGEHGSGDDVSGQEPEDGEEIRQLVRAQELLAPDPLRALRLVRDGNARFQRGYLRQERRYVEVMALFALGRLGEAHAHAQWFLNDYPTGPYREKVDLALLRYPMR